MTKPVSVEGNLIQWSLFVGGVAEHADLGICRGFSLQVDGNLGGGHLVIKSSNTGKVFYPTDKIAAPGLYTPDDDYRYIAAELVDADESARVTLTIYVY